MAPQHVGYKTMMNHQLTNDHHEEDLDDAENLTDEEGAPSSSQSSPEDLFRFIDQQFENVKSQLEECEAKRKEIVREMAEHMLTLGSDDSDNDEDDDDSVCRRHTELTMQLSGIKREQKIIKKQFASIKLLSDKRKDVETLMRTRLKAASNGSSDNFSAEELHQIIESQAFATLEVDILNQERHLLEIQLMESKKQTERLLLQCSEKDERIKLLKQQNDSYRQQISRLNSESPMSSQVSAAEISQISSLRYNLLAENNHIRKRLTIRTSNHDSQISGFTSSTISSKPTTPPSTVQVSEPRQDSTPQTTNQLKPKTDTKSNKELPVDTQGNLSESQRSSSSDDEEKKRLKKQRHLLDEAAKEKERFLREQYIQSEVSEKEERERIEQQRKRQQQKREQWARDEAAKEEERKIRQLQEQLQAARQAQEDGAPIPDEKAAARLAPIPEAGAGADARRASLEVTNYQRQTRRQADRMASRSVLSPTPSTRGGISSRSTTLSPTPSTFSGRSGRSTLSSTPSTASSSAGLSRSMHDGKSLGDGSKDKAYNDMAKSAHGGMPGAMRMAASGRVQIYDDSDDSVSSDESFGDEDYSNDAVAQPESSYTVTATLVKEDDDEDDNDSGDRLSISDRERAFAERERDLEAREAEIAKQARSFHSITAEVVPAVAVATVAPREGSYRSARAMGVSQQSLGNSGRTMGEDGAVGELDAGALRFQPMNEKPLRAQFNEMADSDYYCFSQLQERWEAKRKKTGGAAYSEAIILRFLRNTCKKDGSFNVAKAWKSMRKTKERNLFLSAGKLEKQLLTATLFPVPGLLSIAGFEMFYMKPCRFHRKDSVRDVIDNLVYVINCMLEKEGNAKNGIGFMACMNDWKMKNFEVNYCYQFMMALQSIVVPVNVELFLIVNPPSWFGGIWKIMKPMLAPSFRKKVKVIKEKKLDEYLMEGYQNYLPDDLATGSVDTFQLARDFVSYRKHIEFGNVQLNAKSAYNDDDDKSQISSSTKSDGSKPKTFRGLDSSFRSSSDSDAFFGSAYGSSSHDEPENEDDDASIHCSINGSVDEEDMLEL